MRALVPEVTARASPPAEMEPSASAKGACLPSHPFGPPGQGLAAARGLSLRRRCWDGDGDEDGDEPRGTAPAGVTPHAPTRQLLPPSPPPWGLKDYLYSPGEAQRGSGNECVSQPVTNTDDAPPRRD